jgi:hypothetical protein
MLVLKREKYTHIEYISHCHIEAVRDSNTFFKTLVTQNFHPYLKKHLFLGQRGMAQVVDHLPSKHYTLSSNPNMATRKKKTTPIPDRAK